MAQPRHTTAPEPSSQLHRNRPLASTVDLAKSVLGIWLFISAAVLAPHQASSSFLHGAMFDGMVVGGLLIAGGIYAASRASSTQQLTRTYRRRYWSVFTLALSAWLVVSPWILGFNDSTRLAWNAVICGGVLAILSGVNLLVTEHLGRDQHPGFVA
jgi:SPW repeat